MLEKACRRPYHGRGMLHVLRAPSYLRERSYLITCSGESLFSTYIAETRTTLTIDAATNRD